MDFLLCFCKNVLSILPFSSFFLPFFVSLQVQLLRLERTPNREKEEMIDGWMYDDDDDGHPLM